LSLIKLGYKKINGFMSQVYSELFRDEGKYLPICQKFVI
jgi:hypothetical protein